MTPPVIPDAAVESALNAYHQPGGWMRPALEAAAPYMLRAVWDEAYSKGFEAARGEADTPNPYEVAL